MSSTHPTGIASSLRFSVGAEAAYGVLLAAWWVIRGVVDLFAAATGADVRRGLAVLKGLLSVGAGGFVLVNPGISLATMIFIVGAWLLVYGIVGTAVAVLSRRSP